MEVAEEIEHIPYGDEITSFQDALKGNSANFEKRLERVWFDLTQWTFCFAPLSFKIPIFSTQVLDRKDEAGGEESWQGIEVTNKYYCFICSNSCVMMPW